VGCLGFRDGVSASYSYFRCVRNFDIVYTAAVWLSPANKFNVYGHSAIYKSGLSKRRRNVTGDVTLHTRVNGRQRSPERNYGDVTGDGTAHKCVNGRRRIPVRN